MIFYKFLTKFTYVNCIYIYIVPSLIQINKVMLKHGLDVNAVKTGADLLSNPVDWEKPENVGLFHNYFMIQQMKSEQNVFPKPPYDRKKVDEVADLIDTYVDDAVTSGAANADDKAAIKQITDLLRDQSYDGDFEGISSELGKKFDQIRTNAKTRDGISTVVSSVAYRSSLFILEGLKGSPPSTAPSSDPFWDSMFVLSVDAVSAVGGAARCYTVANAWTGGAINSNPQALAAVLVFGGAACGLLGSWAAHRNL